MIRTCDGNDPNLLAADSSPCACGLEFDDVYYRTVYPHEPVPPPLTEEQREYWMRFLGVGT